MKTSKLKQPMWKILIAAQLACGLPAFAQQSTPAATEAEKEALYTSTLESRVKDITDGLNLTDQAKLAQVRDTITAHYRVMRARDVLIDAQVKALGQEISYATRAERLKAQSKILHDTFFTKLASLLTPEQVETIKDKMTYNKVKVTFEAYGQIIEKLTEEEKAKILEMLKTAREEAVDGGSAPEKSAIFQKYKDQINAYLTANGHNVTQAFKDWTDKHSSDGTNSAAK
jgi:DNA primase large subunit